MCEMANIAFSVWFLELRKVPDPPRGHPAHRPQAIEGKMLALFSRLKQLEDANLQLTKQNEELNARIEGGGSPVVANGGGGAFLTQPAASPLKGPHASAPPSASEVIAFINKKTPKL